MTNSRRCLELPKWSLVLLVTDPGITFHRFGPSCLQTREEADLDMASSSRPACRWPPATAALQPLLLLPAASPSARAEPQRELFDGRFLCREENEHGDVFLEGTDFPVSKVTPS